MLEVDGFHHRNVPIVGIPIPFFHPHGLLRQLLRGFQIVGVELLRRDVIVGIGISGISGLLLLLRGEVILVPLVKNVAGAHAHDDQRQRQRQLDPFLRLFAHHEQTLSDRRMTVSIDGLAD